MWLTQNDVILRMSGRRPAKYSCSNPQHHGEKGQRHKCCSRKWYWRTLALESSRPGLKSGLESLCLNFLICIKDNISTYHIGLRWWWDGKKMYVYGPAMVSCLQSSHHRFIPSLSTESRIRASLWLLNPIELGSSDYCATYGTNF